MTRRLALSPALEAQVGRVRRAAALYPNRDDGPRPLELEELRLARLVVEALEHQARRRRLEAVRPRPLKVLPATPKRRRAQ